MSLFMDTHAIDGGVKAGDVAHPDLRDKVVCTNGDVTDTVGHGTFVSALAAGERKRRRRGRRHRGSLAPRDRPRQPLHGRFARGRHPPGNGSGREGDQSVVRRP